MDSENLLSSLGLVKRAHTWGTQISYLYLNYTLHTDLSFLTRWPYYHAYPQRYREHMLQYYNFMIEGYNSSFGYIHSNFGKDIVVARGLGSRSRIPHFDVIKCKNLWQAHSGNGYYVASGCRRKRGERLRIGKVVQWAFPRVRSTWRARHGHEWIGVDPFGIKSFAVHLTAYIKTEDGTTKYRVPRRAKTKRDLSRDAG